MEEYQPTIHDERESNRNGLDTFHLDRYNMLDHPIDTLIVSLHTRAEEIKAIIENAQNPLAHSSRLSESEIEGFEKDLHNVQDLYYLYDELSALYEIKIIYAFKHLEISIKELLSAAYQNKSINKKFTWDKLEHYLKSKGIVPESIESYTAINQLRFVNNAIKHSGIINDQTLNNIPEFNSQADRSSYTVLANFYDRIEGSPKTFLTSLAGHVYKNLYEFTDEKIIEMAKKVALRMDKEDAQKLTEEIAKHYK